MKTLRSWNRVAVRALFGARGGSLVEFALVLPMMMVLITGMFTLGLILNNYMVLTSMVGTTARTLALTRNQSIPALAGTDPCAYAIQTATTNGPSLNATAVTWSIAWTTTNQSTGVSSTTTYTNTCAGKVPLPSDIVAVSATYPVTFILYGWTPNSMSLNARTAELMQ